MLTKIQILKEGKCHRIILLSIHVEPIQIKPKFVHHNLLFTFFACQPTVNSFLVALAHINHIIIFTIQFIYKIKQKNEI